MQNIFDEFIKRIKKSFNIYLKNILQEQYIEEISKEYIESYIYSRYTDIQSVTKVKSLKNNISENLRMKKEELAENIKYIHHQKEVENTYLIFDHLIRIDEYINSKYIKEEKEYILASKKEQIEKEKKEILEDKTLRKEKENKTKTKTKEEANVATKLEETKKQDTKVSEEKVDIDKIDKLDKLDNIIEDLEKNILEILNIKYLAKDKKELEKEIKNDFNFRKDILFKQHNIDNFYLRNRLIDEKEISIKTKELLKINYINIRYNIDFPMIYSISAIEDVFESGNVNEDKLILGYQILAIKVLDDIIKEKFNEEYLITYPISIIGKTQKRKRLIESINSDILKEKISLIVRYKDFQENTEYIYELSREGYNIAIVVDSSFKLNYASVARLDVFKYIIINKNMTIYEELKDKVRTKNKIIEIDNDI